MADVIRVSLNHYLQLMPMTSEELEFVQKVRDTLLAEAE
jgi:hypothetical protein